MVRLINSVLLASTLLASVDAIPTITQKGAKLFTSDGKQFFNKGMAYQGSPDDPLVDTNQCNLDIALMKTLGVNSIRVYHVDPQKNHDGCMSALAAAGIYVWLDLDTFTTYILQDNPYWTASQFSAYAEVMDAFISYDNLAGFWIGNEIINSAAGSGAAPYIKAAIADMKAYRNSKKYRAAPIGYSAADIAELRPMLQNYLACGDSSTALEFFGLNSYEWCGPTNTFTGSGYSILQDMTKNYNTPIFFSETGCNVGGPRLFEDQDAILGPDMDDTWSGAIIYEWVQETNNYGMVSYAGGLLTGTPTAIAPDFTNLSKRWATLSPTGVSSAAYTPSLSAPACPTSTAGGWLVNGNPSLPTLGVAAVTKVPVTSVAGNLAVVASTTPAAASASTTGTRVTSPSPLSVVAVSSSTSTSASTLASSSFVSSSVVSSSATAASTQTSAASSSRTSSAMITTTASSSTAAVRAGSASAATSAISSTASPGAAMVNNAPGASVIGGAILAVFGWFL